jgi:hypothetical protein
MPHYVYSTITNPTAYIEYAKNSSHDLPVILKKVIINGGHLVSNKHFVTPLGVVTVVSDEDMEMLNNNSAFIRHKERGFITVYKKNIDPEKAARNMAEKDGSSPKTPKDFEPAEKIDGRFSYKAPRSPSADL